MIKYPVSIIILILSLVLNIFQYKTRPEADIIETVKTVIDTVYIEKEPVVITKLATITKVERDTVIQIVEKTPIRKVTNAVIKQDSEVAAMDACWDEGCIDVKFYTKPGLFDLKWDPYPAKVIYKTEYIEKKKRFYENPFLWGAVGLATGVMITR